MKQVKKVVAYVTRDKPHKQILVFEHRDIPEAGVQVPAGTVDPGENIETALLREIEEESGLKFSAPGRFLGCFEWFRKEKNEIDLRHVFHLQANPIVSDEWSHTVVSDGNDNGLIFNFYWLSIEEAKSKLVGANLSYPQRVIKHPLWMLFAQARLAPEVAFLP